MCKTYLDTCSFSTHLIIIFSLHVSMCLLISSIYLFVSVCLLTYSIYLFICNVKRVTFDLANQLKLFIN